MNSPAFPNETEIPMFRKALLRWYDREKRNLPWRQTKDAYRVWVSEIMLQQTRVNAVLDHYRDFLSRFPTVHVLAEADLDTVLAAWSGLGYYRRARHLHSAAKKVVSEFAGALPESAAGLRELPGIGRYTAAAIASISYREKCAVLDGNVERVLGRIYGNPAMSSAELWSAAEELVSAQRPGDFNQAMMELGATVCIPSEPRCLVCPIHRWCRARGSQPRVRENKRKVGELHQALIVRGDCVKLVRRSKSETVMTGMWELPELESVSLRTNLMATVKHSIMNTDYRVQVWKVAPQAATGGRWWASSKLSQLPLTGLARKILRRAELF